MRRRLVVLSRAALLLVTAGLTTACTALPELAPQPSGSAPLSSPAVSPAGPGFVSCDHSIGAPKTPPTDYTVILGDVALPTQVLQVNEAGEAGGPKLFAKQGLLVRLGAAVELRVAPGWEGRAWIGWGSPAERTAKVAVAACGVRGLTATAAGPWLAFAGGYWLDSPACVPLLVRTASGETEARVAVGATCG